MAVSLRAVGRGVAAGLMVAALLALGLALAADRTPVAESVVAAVLWVARVVVSTAAGWFAGRGSDSGAVLPGTLAGLSLAVLGSLVAAETGLPLGPVGVTLAVGMVWRREHGWTWADCQQWLTAQGLPYHLRTLQRWQVRWEAAVSAIVQTAVQWIAQHWGNRALAVFPGNEESPVYFGES